MKICDIIALAGVLGAPPSLREPIPAFGSRAPRQRSEVPMSTSAKIDLPISPAYGYDSNPNNDILSAVSLSPSGLQPEDQRRSGIADDEDSRNQLILPAEETVDTELHEVEMFEQLGARKRKMFVTFVECHALTDNLEVGQTAVIDLTTGKNRLYTLRTLLSMQARNIQIAHYDMKTGRRLPNEVRIECDRPGIFDMYIGVIANNSALKVTGSGMNVCRYTVNCVGREEAFGRQDANKTVLEATMSMIPAVLPLTGLVDAVNKGLDVLNLKDIVSSRRGGSALTLEIPRSWKLLEFEGIASDGASDTSSVSGGDIQSLGSTLEEADVVEETDFFGMPIRYQLPPNRNIAFEEFNDDILVETGY